MKLLPWTCALSCGNYWRNKRRYWNTTQPIGGLFMKRILSVLAIGMLGAWATAAQSTTSGQAGASAQTKTTVQTSNSGAQASDNGMASTSGTANAGNNS